MRDHIKALMSALVVLLVLAPGAALAQEEERTLVLRVDGLACPFCAYGLEKKMMALPGVVSYDADLREGKVFVGLSADASVDEEDVRRRVKKSGFTLRGLTVETP